MALLPHSSVIVKGDHTARPFEEIIITENPDKSSCTISLPERADLGWRVWIINGDIYGGMETVTINALNSRIEGVLDDFVIINKTNPPRKTWNQICFYYVDVERGWVVS